MGNAHHTAASDDGSVPRTQRKAPEFLTRSRLSDVDVVLAKVSRLGVGGRVTCLDFEAVHKILALASSSGLIQLYGGKGIQVVLRPPSSDPVIMLRFQPGLMRLVAVTERCIEMWDWTTGKRLHTLDVDHEYGMEVNAVDLGWSHENRFLVCGLSDGRVIVYDCRLYRLSGYFIKPQPPPTLERPAIEFAEPFEEQRQKRLQYEEELRALVVNDVAVHPKDPNQLLIGYSNSYVLLWYIRSRERASYYRCSGEVVSMAWESTGSRFASADDDGQALIWNKKRSSKPALSLFPPTDTARYPIKKIVWTFPLTKESGSSIVVVNGGASKASGNGVTCFSANDGSQLNFYPFSPAINVCTDFVLAYRSKSNSNKEASESGDEIPYLIEAANRNDVFISHPSFESGRVQFLPVLRGLSHFTVSSDEGTSAWLRCLRRLRVRLCPQPRSAPPVSGGAPSNTHSMPALLLTASRSGTISMYDFTTPFDADCLFTIELKTLLAQNESLVASQVLLCCRTRTLVLGCESGHVLVLGYERRRSGGVKGDPAWIEWSGAQPPIEGGEGFVLQALFSQHTCPIRLLQFSPTTRRVAVSDTNGSFSLNCIDSASCLRLEDLNAPNTPVAASQERNFDVEAATSKLSAESLDDEYDIIQVISFCFAEVENFVEESSAPLVEALLIGLSDCSSLALESVSGSPLAPGWERATKPLLDVAPDRFLPEFDRIALLNALCDSDDNVDLSGPLDLGSALPTRAQPVILLGPLDVQSRPISLPSFSWEELQSRSEDADAGLRPKTSRYITPRYFVGVWNSMLRICVLQDRKQWSCLHEVKLSNTVLLASLICTDGFDDLTSSLHSPASQSPSNASNAPAPATALVTIDSDRCLRVHRLLDLEELLCTQLDASHRMNLKQCCVTYDGRFCWMTLEDELVTAMLFVDKLRMLNAPVVYDDSLCLRATSSRRLSPMFSELPTQTELADKHASSNIIKSIKNAMGKPSIIQLLSTSLDEMVLLNMNQHHQQEQEATQQDRPDWKQKEQQQDIAVPTAASDSLSVRKSGAVAADSSSAVGIAVQKAEENLETLQHTEKASAKLNDAAAQFLSSVQQLQRQQQNFSSKSNKSGNTKPSWFS